MMRYAMVLLGRVIDIVESDTVPEYPPDGHGNPVTAVVCDDTVKLGMLYDVETGVFSEYAPEPIPIPPPTDTELIMQALSDTELRDFEAQGERELLAQQMTDMELLLMEGGGMV